MKKFSFLLLSLFLILALAACNNNENASGDPAPKENTEKIEEIGPTEPTEDSKCAGCQMKIYLKDEEMGQFTAQALTED